MFWGLTLMYLTLSCLSNHRWPLYINVNQRMMFFTASTRKSIGGFHFSSLTRTKCFTDSFLQKCSYWTSTRRKAAKGNTMSIHCCRHLKHGRQRSFYMVLITNTSKCMSRAIRSVCFTQHLHHLQMSFCSYHFHSSLPISALQVDISTVFN